MGSWRRRRRNIVFIIVIIFNKAIPSLHRVTGYCGPLKRGGI
jgi:hypothetical protein